MVSVDEASLLKPVYARLLGIVCDYWLEDLACLRRSRILPLMIME